MKEMKKTTYFPEGRTDVGIHTGSGTTKKIIDDDDAKSMRLIESYNIRKVRNENKSETYMKINPNKRKKGYILTSYQDFMEVTQDLFNDLGITDFYWKRIDLSFSVRDNEYFEEYTKVYRFLVACFTCLSVEANSYDGRKFWTEENNSLAAKTQRWEIVYYDKRDESKGKSPYQARLELRSKRMKSNIEEAFCNEWPTLLDRALEQFELVQDTANEHLAEIYWKDQEKDKKDRSYTNSNSFLLAKKDFIFTSQQMKKLLLMIGLSEDQAKNKIGNFRKAHNIEYIKRKDLQFMIEDIKEKIGIYFDREYKRGKILPKMKKSK